MGDSRVAAGLDRLPWLADEPERATKRGKRGRAGWALAGALIVAGLSIWIPSAIPTREAQPVGPLNTAPPAISVPLPEPRPARDQEVRIEPPPQVAPARVDEVAPAPIRELRMAPAQSRNTIRDQSAQTTSAATARTKVSKNAAPLTAPIAANSRTAPLRPWSPRVTAGAAGRLVQVGAYGSPIQAKLGWRAMVRAYPAMQRLPALVVESRNSRGRLFYRFQVGTTSQAHSEVLCQRMQKIDLSCAVVGLPWKAKVER